MVDEISAKLRIDMVVSHSSPFPANSSALISCLQNPNKEQEEKEELAKRVAPKPKPKYDPKSGKWVVMNWDGSVAGVENGDNRSFENLDKTPESLSVKLSNIKTLS